MVLCQTPLPGSDDGGFTTLVKSNINYEVSDDA